MKYWIDAVRGALRQPRIRLVVCGVGMLIALKVATYGWGAKLIAVALFAGILWELCAEWRRFLPPFRQMLFRRAMRVMKALRPLRRLPPDVPVLYGAVMMYMIVRVIMASLQLISPMPFPYEMLFIGSVISIGALRHTHLILTRIAKWSWGKLLGKALYAISTVICVAMGTAEATRTTRLLTHADAKYFPSFLGLLSSWYVAINFIRFAAFFFMACGLMLVLINLPSLFLRSARGWVPFFPKKGTNKVFVWWRRVRFGRRADPALLQGRYLRDIVELFTPVALLGLAGLIVAAPESIAKSQLTATLLNQTLFVMEYTADDGCPSVAGNLPTVHLEGDFVSVGILANNRLATTRQACHAVQKTKP